MNLKSLGVTYQPRVVDLLDSHTQAGSGPKNLKCMMFIPLCIPQCQGWREGALGLLQEWTEHCSLPAYLLCHLGSFAQRRDMGGTLGHCPIPPPSLHFPVLIGQQNES